MSRMLWSFLLPAVLLFAPSFAAAYDETSDDEQTLRQAGLQVDAATLVQQFRQRTPDAAALRKARDDIRQLGSEDFVEREQASAALVALGQPCRALLLLAVKDPDAEVSRRASVCLEQIGKRNDTHLMEACARLLAQRAPPGAAAVLLDYVPFAEDPYLIDKLAEALTRVGVQHGQAQPALLTALSDPMPAKRALAGEALVRGGVLTQRAAARRLLHDADSWVRERVALALLDAHDREAVPALIRLVGEQGPMQRVQAEDALMRLAGEHAPPSVDGETEADRHHRFEGWKAWWQKRGLDVNLANYDGKRQLGYTLLCVMNNQAPITGRVVELNAAGKVRWQFEGLRYPIDAQVIGPDRVLVAEYQTRQVTVRNFHGEVLWHYDAPNLVLSARRQRDGRTVVVTRDEVIDLDREGQVLARLRAGPGRIAAALRLPNRDTAVFTMNGEFTLFDPSGKSIRSFNLNCRLFPLGCNIEALPNGNMLVPIYMMALPGQPGQSGQVVEVDTTGKIVWHVPATCPVAAQRLANGHTLVTSRLNMNVTEIDRDGKVVAVMPATGRVLRASRR